MGTTQLFILPCKLNSMFVKDKNYLSIFSKEDINKFSQIINHDFSQDSTTSLEIAELVQQLKIIMENLLKVLVTQKAYILYVDVWQRF